MAVIKVDPAAGRFDSALCIYLGAVDIDIICCTYYLNRYCIECRVVYIYIRIFKIKILLT